LIEKYKLKEVEAQEFADFLLPMLEFFPDRRITAQDALKSSWFNMPSNVDFRMDDKEFREYQTKKKMRMFDEEEVFPNKHESEEADAWDGDSEENWEPGDESHIGHVSGNVVMSRYIRATLDRSFYHGGYIGYGEGISLGEIDQGSNWQFHKLEDVKDPNVGQSKPAQTTSSSVAEKKGERVSGDVSAQREDENPEVEEAGGKKKRKKNKHKKK
jgi:serine/threonine protein kinase